MFTLLEKALILLQELRKRSHFRLCTPPQECIVQMKKSNVTVSYPCVEIWDTLKQKVPDFFEKKMSLR